MEADPASDNRSSRASRASSSAASPKAASPRPPPAAAAAAAIEEAAAAEQERLAQQLSDTVEELAAAREDLQRRKDSHLRREKKMQDEIAHLNHALQEAIGARSAPEQMQTIRSTHGAIQDRLSDMQGRTVELLNQQKEAMARQFRMRLAEVVEAKTKSNEQEHSAEEWASRFGKAQDHLKRTETQLIDADRRNKLLEAENKRMRSQYRSQENDREFLVRQLVSVKRDNARLREELQRSNARNASAASAASAADGGSSVGGSSRPGTAGR
jgi:chromosome segregation ATPase